MNTIYMGRDSREAEAFAVASESILRRTNPDAVQIISLGASINDGYMWAPYMGRPVELRGGKLWCPISQASMATEFAISRFCVPFLQRRGWALFADCDIVCLGDVADLFALADDRYAVMCVKHRQETGPAVKMDGQQQTYYLRKNWSSVVLWNCGHPANKRLTREALNGWPGRDLHAFRWLEDREIGELPKSWNFLVGVDQVVDEPEFSGTLCCEQECSPAVGDVGPVTEVTPINLLHFTLGGPWLPGWSGGPLDHVWEEEQRQSCVS